MGFDIRVPIGLMFSVFGVLVGGYGAATQGDEMYARHSLGVNVNLWWEWSCCCSRAVEGWPRDRRSRSPIRDGV